MEVDGENLKENVVELANEMGVAITGRDINACHRLGAARQGIRSRIVIFGFFVRNNQHQFLVNMNKLREKDGSRNMFINEDLTPLRSTVRMGLSRHTPEMWKSAVD